MTLRWLVVLLAVYVASYLVLSRLGMQWSSRNGYEFYFFFAPEDEFREQLHEVGCTLYWPLIAGEQLVGTSNGPSAPLVKKWSRAENLVREPALLEISYQILSSLQGSVIL